MTDARQETFTSPQPAGGGGGSGGQSRKDQAKGAARDVEHRAADEAGTVKDEALAKADEVRHEAMDHARQLVDEARGRLGEQADETTTQLAARLGEAADELRSLARNSDRPDGPVTQLIGQLGEQAGRLAGRMEHDGYRGLTSDATRYARRRPGSFLVMAAAAGFAVGRLLRNSDTQALTQAAKGDGDHDASPDRELEPAMAGLGDGSSVGGGSLGATVPPPTVVPPVPPEQGGVPSDTGVRR
jgi:hypothetical protein